MKKFMQKISEHKVLLFALVLVATVVLYFTGNEQHGNETFATLAVISLTELEKEGLTEDEQKVLLAVKKASTQAYDDFKKGHITKEQLKEELAGLKESLNSNELKALKDELKELDEKFKTQGLELGKLRDNSNGSTKVETLVSVIEKHKDALAASTKKGKDFEFTIKADTLRASVVGNQSALNLPDVGQLAHRKLTVYDMFRKVPVPQGSNGVVRYVDWDADTTVRAAAAIAEGGTFPESTAKWATYTLALQKVGDIIPMSEELMYDAPLFAAELTNFLQTNVAIKVDTDLVNGNGTAPNINGLKVQVPNFTPVASGITDASIYDLLVKLREAISAPYGSKYSPNVALMNIADINKMKLKKDLNNNYILPPFYDRNGSIVDGISVIECNAFAANTMVIGDSRYGAIYEIPGVTVETGYATGDYESDMMSIKARKRLNLLIRNVDRTGWLEVTSISAALTTLAT